MEKEKKISRRSPLLIGIYILIVFIIHELVVIPIYAKDGIIRFEYAFLEIVLIAIGFYFIFIKKFMRNKNEKLIVETRKIEILDAENLETEFEYLSKRKRFEEIE